MQFDPEIEKTARVTRQATHVAMQWKEKMIEPKVNVCFRIFWAKHSQRRARLHILTKNPRYFNITNYVLLGLRGVSFDGSSSIDPNEYLEKFKETC